ncbi:lantibiotic ABC transporter permease [Apilactobacillus timberlakei]|uniref:ABC transporter permease n=1 Tax=Apilactobacillus timberlakei TaxID=2008380 RepID=UPI00112BC934|nr:ABC transporter permease [Apilactobacillus timberlakei]TPR23391.1 lantibiotic ABC transporter permease [Apilactobacillus timberlakei]
MILKIQLKKVFRNKRFLLFTIVFPALWYMLLLHLSKSYEGVTKSLNQNTLFMIGCLIGIVGNSIVTFSKRVSNTKKFYTFQSKITDYSIWSFLLHYIITQIILNLIIVILISLIGIISNAIEMNYQLLMLILLTILIGIYLSVIGFLWGIILDNKTVDASATPLMLIVGNLFVPYKQMFSGGFVNIIDIIQRIFPLHYVMDISSEIINNKSILQSFSMFIITFIITLIPFLLIIWFKFIKKEVA